MGDAVRGQRRGQVPVGSHAFAFTRKLLSAVQMQFLSDARCTNCPPSSSHASYICGKVTPLRPFASHFNTARSSRSIKYVW
eukprot:scaffold7163_cov111-Skeletonema_marinoi.AAC.2